MNTYNVMVFEQYCRESHYNKEESRELRERLEERYGSLLDTQDVFAIDTNSLIVEYNTTP